MGIFDLFMEKAPNKVFISIVLGGIAGASYSFLIPLVLAGLEGNTNLSSQESHLLLGFEVSQYRIAYAFFFACIFVLTARTISQVILNRVSLDVTTALRIKIYEKISGAYIANLEKTGSSKLIATITTDVGRIVGGARALPDLIISSITIIGMLGFLLYLNYAVFIFVIQIIVLGVITFQLPVMLGNRYFHKARTKIDLLHESIHGLIYGAKELKLSKTKKSNFFGSVLVDSEYKVLSAEKTGSTIIRVAENYGDMISFFVIGIVAFLFVNYESMSKSELVGVVMALLYLTAPVAMIIGNIPALMMAKISLNKVSEILEGLEVEPESCNDAQLPAWDTIRVKDVTYQHLGTVDEPGFSIGPISLELHKGQVVFIVGGNGSGKSTFSKILTQHYLASSGSLKFGDTLITSENINAARNSICSIYSDYYLFDRLLLDPEPGEQERIQGYLEMLLLDKKVKIVERHFSTRSLSDGQKKRLALLAALLEDKPVYLFDEWAADQDPVFKDIFYNTIVHDLASKGKVIIVISHDDRYFSVADRIIHMEQGNLLRIEEQNKGKLNDY